ncbi:MAG: sodium:solute symporter [bacterium]
MDTAAGIRFGDVLTLLAYFSVTLGIGVWCALRLSTTEGYFVGNRSIPGWAIGVSMLGTAISSVTFLAYPGSAFSTNWSKLVPGLMIVFAVILAVYVFVPYFRRANLVSAYEYLEYRFDPWARVYGCVVWSLYQFYRMGLILYLLALPVRVMTGYDVYFIIVVLGILITIYTVMGGLEAVIWTDVMQTIVLLMGGVLCIWIVFAKVPESTGEMLAYAWNSKKFSLADPDPTHVYAYTFNFLYETIWVLMLYGLFQNLQEFASDQTRVQRYCAAKSDVQARNAVWLGGLGCIPVWAMFMFVGTSLWLFYQQFPERLPEGILSDAVFPHFILTELPVGFAGFVIAAVMAAAMSSIDSSMNGTATVVTSDLYRRFYRRTSSDRHYLNVARVVTFIAGAGAIFFAALFAWIVENNIIQHQTVVDIAFFLIAVLSAGLGGLFYLGLFTTRTNSRGALIGIICAVLITIYMTVAEISETVPRISHRLMIIVISNVVAFVIGYFASFLFSAPPQERLHNLTVWTGEEKPAE